MYRHLTSEECTRCTKCRKYLIDFPVYGVVDSVDALCSSCVESEIVVRLVAYEAVAKTAFYPCIYGGRGCREYFPSSEKKHFGSCWYRSVQCLVCLKICKITNLSVHYATKHSELMYDEDVFRVGAKNRQYLVERGSQNFLVSVWPLGKLAFRLRVDAIGVEKNHYSCVVVYDGGTEALPVSSYFHSRNETSTINARSFKLEIASADLGRMIASKVVKDLECPVCLDGKPRRSGLEADAQFIAQHDCRCTWTNAHFDLVEHLQTDHEDCFSSDNPLVTAFKSFHVVHAFNRLFKIATRCVRDGVLEFEVELLGPFAEEASKYTADVRIVDDVSGQLYAEGLKVRPSSNRKLYASSIIGEPGKCYELYVGHLGPMSDCTFSFLITPRTKSKLCNQLRCSACSRYLTKGPMRTSVYGRSYCGDCEADKPNVREFSYEILSDDLVFPCKNFAHGCRETFNPADQEDHERSCSFTQLGCFLNCTWTGALRDVLSHYRIKHRDFLLSGLELSDKKSGGYVLLAEEGLFVLTYKPFFNLLSLTGASESHACRITSTDGTSSEFAIPTTKPIAIPEEAKIVVYKDASPKVLPENERVLKALLCVNCNLYMSAPIYQCRLGHGTCKFCVDSTSVCRRCPSSVRADSRNFALESLCELAVYPCKNVSCRSLQTSKDKDGHEKYCGLSVIACPCHGCISKVPRHLLADHLRSIHGRQMVDDENCRFDYTEPTIHDGIYMERIDGLFRLDQKYSGKSFAWSVRYVGNPAKCRRYKFTLRFGNEIYLQRAVHSIDGEPFKSASDYVQLDIDMARPYITEKCLVYKLYIDLTESE